MQLRTKSSIQAVLARLWYQNRLIAAGTTVAWYHGECFWAGLQEGLWQLVRKRSFRHEIEQDEIVHPESPRDLSSRRAGWHYQFGRPANCARGRGPPAFPRRRAGSVLNVRRQ